MEFKDYYQTLNVERDTSDEEIKRSYRRLARKYHPDVSKEANAEESFKEVQEAYEVLRDPEKRAAYDRFGANWKAGQDVRPEPGREPPVNPWGQEHGDTGEFSDFFSSLYGNRGHETNPRDHRHARLRGEDLHAKIQLSPEESFAGVTHTINFNVPELDEHGHLYLKTRTLKTRIPKGVINGQRIRLTGQGGAGIGGAPKGDLYLEVTLKTHAVFRIDARDVYVDVPVTPWEAMLGATIPVPTLGGRVELKIPPGSDSGKKLRLAERGLPGNPAGDQYVTLQVVLPKAESTRARELYEQMANEMPFDPREALDKALET